MSNFPKGLRAVGFHVSMRDLLKPGGKVTEEIKSTDASGEVGKVLWSFLRRCSLVPWWICSS